MNKKEMNNKGFSLVELIIVIAIMAILIGVLAPQFIKFVEKSRESTDLQNVEEVKTAVETYCADKGDSGTLPASITVTCNKAPGSITCSCTDLDEYGIADAGIKTKSSKWSANFVWTYNTTGTDAFQWKNTTTATATYFKSDGSPNS